VRTAAASFTLAPPNLKIFIILVYRFSDANVFELR